MASRAANAPVPLSRVIASLRRMAIAWPSCVPTRVSSPTVSAARRSPATPAAARAGQGRGGCAAAVVLNGRRGQPITSADPAGDQELLHQQNHGHQEHVFIVEPTQQQFHPSHQQEHREAEGLGTHGGTHMQLI